MKMRVYITFMDENVHVINGVRYDKDCVAAIDAKSFDDGKRLAFAHFGRDFESIRKQKSFEEYITEDEYPRGIIIIR